MGMLNRQARARVCSLGKRFRGREGPGTMCERVLRVRSAVDCLLNTAVIKKNYMNL